MDTKRKRGGHPPECTGRHLVIGRPGRWREMTASLKDEAGLDLANSLDFADQAIDPQVLQTGDGVFLNEIGIAVVTRADAGQLERIGAMDALGLVEDGQSAVEPERVVRAAGAAYGAYLRGYQDALDTISALCEVEPEPGADEDEAFDSLSETSTWGLRTTRAVPDASSIQAATGLGIRIAVLDTGMDPGHPDFAGRAMAAHSFVPGETARDGNGHGTHCLGTACGPEEISEATAQRYGVAGAAEIFVGKVLSDTGSGTDGAVLAGINWAIANGCHVVGLSLGAPALDAGFSVAFETAAQLALARGALLVAAAGNDDGRAVSHPANCPSIMAVGAVGRNLRTSDFSPVMRIEPEGKVDIVGPGVDVLSSVPVSMGRYGTLSGSSMAAAHVAGIAALHAQTSTAYRGAALWQRLIATAMPLSSQPATHVGAGLVQAPYRRLTVHPGQRFWLPAGRALPFPVGSTGRAYAAANGAGSWTSA